MCGQQIHMLFDHCFRFAIPIQVLSHWLFYQAPVELETIKDGTLPSIFYRCGTTNHKVPSTSSMENSWSPFRWQYASPFVRADVPCQFLIRFTFPNQFVRDDLNDLNYNSFSCMYREGSSKLTANTSCTEGSTSAPNFLASKIGANLPRILQMSLLNFQVSLLPSSLSPSCTLTSPLLHFAQQAWMLKIFRVQDSDYSRSASHPIWRLAAHSLWNTSLAECFFVCVKLCTKEFFTFSGWFPIV